MSKNKNKNKNNEKSKTSRVNEIPKKKNDKIVQSTLLKNKVHKKKSKNKNLNKQKVEVTLNTQEKQPFRSENKRKKLVLLPLRERMLSHLQASRFRFLNEQMYVNNSTESKKYFQEDPQAFQAYHEGYKKQLQQWPMNPVDVIIESIKKMPKEYVVADFGCGEAKIASSVPHTVHSFDLVAVNDKVKACDMASTPLLTGRVNIVVFCLSLMGSNLKDYLLEANRVLNKNGILKIAEVESRFGKVEDFIKLMTKYGFTNTWKDLSHNLFYFMDFKKTKDVLKKDSMKLPDLTLKPCFYKKRIAI